MVLTSSNSRNIQHIKSWWQQTCDYPIIGNRYWLLATTNIKHTCINSLWQQICDLHILGNSVLVSSNFTNIEHINNNWQRYVSNE